MKISKFVSFPFILIIIAIIMISIKGKFGFNPVQYVTVTVFTPAQSLVTNFSHSVSHLFEHEELEKNKDLEIKKLKEKIKSYQDQLVLFDYIKKENETLKSELSFLETVDTKVVPAKVISRDPSLLSDSILINKGSIDNIQKNMTIVTYNDVDSLVLVGRVSSVTPFVSKVTLVSSRNFYVGVRLDTINELGLLKGYGFWNQDATVDFISIESSPFIGELIYTSGESEIFPEGLLIGRVSGISRSISEQFFQTIYVDLMYEYNKLDRVYIVDYQTPYDDLEQIKEDLENV